MAQTTGTCFLCRGTKRILQTYGHDEPEYIPCDCTREAEAEAEAEAKAKAKAKPKCPDGRLDDAAELQGRATYTTGYDPIEKKTLNRVVSQDFLMRVQDQAIEVAAQVMEEYLSEVEKHHGLQFMHGCAVMIRRLKNKPESSSAEGSDRMAVTHAPIGPIVKPVYRVTWDQVFKCISSIRSNLLGNVDIINHPRVYGVPRGGMIAAGFMCQHDDFQMCCDPDCADIIIDDIIDTGKTRDKYRCRYPQKPFLAFFDKTGADAHLGKIIMPWEPDKIEEDDARHIQAVSDMVTALESRGTLQQPVAHLFRTAIGVLEEFVVHNPMT